MNTLNRLLIFCTSMLVSISLSAQLEVTHLFVKGFSAFGLGGVLHAGYPIVGPDEIGGEAGLYFFGSNGHHAAVAPCLLSYRHSLDGSGTGYYLEPFAGYSFAGTDIQKTDSTGSPLYTSNFQQVDQKMNGVTAGLGFGYIIASHAFPVNICLRYSHTFVSGDPSTNMISLRICYSSVGDKASRQF
jgi:hypothetical protein